MRLSAGALLALISNLLPLVGVFLWGWDVFLVLLVYWFETVIVAFWTVVRIASMSSTQVSQLRGGDEGSRWRAIPLALFFTLHSGIFLGVHFMFLWTLFSGEWPRRVHGLSDFVDVLIVATGLWIPLVVLFVAYALVFLRQVTGRSLVGQIGGVVWGGAGSAASPEPINSGLLVRLYARIFVMQFAIILGGMLALALGSMGPLLILIAIKTVFETVSTFR